MHLVNFLLVTLASSAAALPTSGVPAGCNAPWIKKAQSLARLLPNDLEVSLCSSFLGKYKTVTATSTITATSTCTSTSKVSAIADTPTITISDTQTAVSTTSALTTVTSYSSVPFTAEALTTTTVATSTVVTSATSTATSSIHTTATESSTQTVTNTITETNWVTRGTLTPTALGKRGVPDLPKLFGIQKSLVSQFCACVATGAPSTVTKTATISTKGRATVVKTLTTTTITPAAVTSTTVLSKTSTLTLTSTSTTVVLTTTTTIVPNPVIVTSTFVTTLTSTGLVSTSVTITDATTTETLYSTTVSTTAIEQETFVPFTKVESGTGCAFAGLGSRAYHHTSVNANDIQDCSNYCALTPSCLEFAYAHFNYPNDLGSGWCQLYEDQGEEANKDCTHTNVDYYVYYNRV